VRLSFSKLKDFEICNRKYWLNHIKKVPFIPNVEMERGRKIHEILYKSTFEIDWKGWLLNHPEYGTFKDMLDNYITYQTTIVGMGGSAKPAKAEYKIYNSDMDFSAVIDRADKFNGQILLTDYKSDAKPNYTKHDDQLLLYTYLLEEETPGLKIHYIAPFFLKHETMVKPKPVDRKKQLEVVNWAKKLKSEIEAKGFDEINFPACPGNLCGWCSHHAAGYCEEGKKHMNKNNVIIEMGDNNEVLANISKEDKSSK
jgi:hypothetical protein